MAAIVFDTLADVLAHEWSGDGGAEGQPDYDLHEALHVFLKTNTSDEERKVAINHAFSAYGGGPDNRPARHVVNDYISNWVDNPDLGFLGEDDDE